MKNKHVLLSKSIAFVCAFGLSGMAWGGQELGPLGNLIGNLTVRIATPPLAKSVAQEFATEYDAHRSNTNKASDYGTIFWWLKNNRKDLIKAAAIAGNSNNPQLAHYVAQELVTALDPLIHQGPMRKKLDAAKVYFWLHDHKQELTEVVAGETDFPDALAQEGVAVLSPLVDKEVLDKNIDKAKTLFWVRKHKNKIIGAAAVGGVVCLATAFGAGYYLGNQTK